MPKVWQKRAENDISKNTPLCRRWLHDFAWHSPHAVCTIVSCTASCKLFWAHNCINEMSNNKTLPKYAYVCMWHRRTPTLWLIVHTYSKKHFKTTHLQVIVLRVVLSVAVSVFSIQLSRQDSIMWRKKNHGDIALPRSCLPERTHSYCKEITRFDCPHQLMKLSTRIIEISPVKHNHGQKVHTMRIETCGNSNKYSQVHA